MAEYLSQIRASMIKKVNFSDITKRGNFYFLVGQALLQSWTAFCLEQELLQMGVNDLLESGAIVIIKWRRYYEV